MAQETVRAGDELPRSKYHFDFQKDICLGCGTCVSVCSIFHEGLVDESVARIKLNRRIFGVEYAVDICRQCDHAECYYACPEGAVRVEEKTGARIMDEDLCTGCGLCIEACPFDVVFFSEERKVALKCDFCGGDPQCVKLCPTGALTLLEG